jgi:hypothetical protein
MGKDPVDGAVHNRDGQAVQHRGDRHDHVVAGEGLLRGQTPTGGKQLVGSPGEHVQAGRLVGEAGELDRTPSSTGG